MLVDLFHTYIGISAYHTPHKYTQPHMKHTDTHDRTPQEHVHTKTQLHVYITKNTHKTHGYTHNLHKYYTYIHKRAQNTLIKFTLTIPVGFAPFFLERDKRKV